MKKSLLETNPYLKDPAALNQALIRNIVSSSAIEGIYLKEETADSVKEDTPTFITCKR